MLDLKEQFINQDIQGQFIRHETHFPHPKPSYSNPHTFFRQPEYVGFFSKNKMPASKIIIDSPDIYEPVTLEYKMTKRGIFCSTHLRGLFYFW